VVAPGADPGAIALGFEGADRLEIDSQGDLVVHMAGGAVRFQKPIVYQELDGARQIVPGHYAFKSDDRVGFQVAAYDAGKALIIDPVLAYSTYLGGSGGDYGRGIAVDGAGNAYVTGSTLSTDFPTKDPIQANNAGGYDVFVAKLNANGSALVFSTYLGGTQHAFAIAVDADGNAYVTGRTGSADSTNFPTTPGAFQEQDPGGNNSAFVTKLSAAGALLYSTYLGGRFSDVGFGIAVKPGCTEVPEASCNVYVTGETKSTDDPDTPEDEGFPTTPEAFQPDFGGGFSDAFVAVLNPTGNGLDALLFSTYLGGTSGERGRGIAVDAAGNAYVTGRTGSTDFPTASPPDSAGPFQPILGGDSSDAFVTKLNATGTTLLYSTYLGGSGSDEGWGIALDGSGNAFVTGVAGDDFPTNDPIQANNAGNLSAFVTKLNPAGNGFNDLLFSTYLGGTSADRGKGIAVDAAGDAYVTGETSTDFPTTEGAFQTKLGGTDSTGGRGRKFKSTSVNSDAFVTIVGASGVVIMTLTATGYKVKGLQKADLAWSGAPSANVDIYRDVGLIMTTENDGFYTDNIDQKGGGTYTYQVCEGGTLTCSNVATVTF
ncbi:MAG: SBBP repeat-containing protein, partial [Acidimicrobiia bacterium]